MIIHEFYYNNRRLYIEFSTKEDGDDFYRILELPYEDIIYYSVDIIDETDIVQFEENSVVELIDQYLLDNDLPEELSLWYLLYYGIFRRKEKRTIKRICTLCN